MKHVALIALDHLDREAFCYALNARQRMDAQLDILTKLPPEEVHRAVIEARGTANTPWRVIQVGDDRDDEISRYVSDQSGLLFLASSYSDTEARSLRDKFWANGPRLGIAWVVVEGR